ncbi:helix-turn-helix transcriptional regulator [uncultured Lacticaseibacillus sp.]|uniref:helix-turn-helix domain-containing protein n=1 Tax=uncultured Lacticaseibacillus sp. TaxID=2775882 RepID=UPI00259A4FB4|nr:helix-turn-helix transcriptional regulator [uncultured Lacticaseibacillus sp.]
MPINKRFRELREEQGWSVEDLSDGIATARSVHNFEAGERDLAISKVQAMLARMGVTLRTFAVAAGKPDEELGHWQRLGTKAESPVRMKHQFEQLAVRYREHPTDVNFYQMMVMAGDYYYAAHRNLVSNAEIEHLSALLVASGSWDETQLEVLHAVMVMLPSPKVLVLTREVLQATITMRGWNQMGYVSAWTVITRGLRVLVARRSNYAQPLMKEIDAAGMDEHLIESRFGILLLKRLGILQDEDTDEHRQAVFAMYNMLPVLQNRHMVVYFEETLMDTVGMTPGQLQEPVPQD